MIGFKRHNDGPPPVRMAGSVSAGAVTIWEHLARPTQSPARFDPSLVAEFPESARRWLTHAIAACPGSDPANGRTDPGTAMAAFEADCRVEHGTADLSTDIHLDPAGAPRSVNTVRWGNPLGEPFGGYGFGADLDDEATVDGITIRRASASGYFHGTQRWSEGEFFRAQITEARFI
jgi:hypothetical protein